MKTIERIEKIIANAENTKFEKDGINLTFYWAYRTAKSTGNELIDFHDIIWERDVPQIVDNLKEFGITEFTISSGFSSLVDIIAAFTANGCTLIGTTKVRANYTDFTTGKVAVLNAIVMKIN